GAADIEPGQEMEFIASLMQDPNSFMYMIGKAYPPAILATLGLTAGGLAQGAGALAHLALNGAALGGVVLAGKRLFMDGYYNKSASASKKNVKPLEEAVKTHSVYQSVYLLDQRLVLRTPVYLFNCVGTIVIIPVLLVLLPLFTGEMDLGMMRLLYLQFYDYFPIGVGAAFILMAALNPTQSTTFSREGQASWLQGVIPLKKSDLFIGKLIFPLVLQLAVIIVLAIAFALLFLMSPLSIAGGLLIGIFGSLPVIAFGLYIDRLRPKLNWDNPQKAVKQNLNVIFNMLAGLVWVVLTCVGGGALIHFFDFSPLWITLIIVVVSLIAFIGLYQMFLKINEAK
ncbi:MAG TPA: hypothetical protein DHN33_08035, partial [Eubacteriaceae bacterium]|nr:hypothetical protein [Eubacteriaceae bacterium]